MTADRLMFGLIFLALLYLKVPLSVDNYDQQSMSVDGGYYMDIAQNIRDGLGFVSDVSPFHQGLPDFPHPTPEPCVGGKPRAAHRRVVLAHRRIGHVGRPTHLGHEDARGSESTFRIP